MLKRSEVSTLVLTQSANCALKMAIRCHMGDDNSWLDPYYTACVTVPSSAGKQSDITQCGTRAAVAAGAAAHCAELGRI